MNWRLIEEDVVEEAAIKPGMSLKHNKYIKNWSPDYGNVLILAGGAGSGKGFAYDMAIDFDGKKFDVDQLKSQLMKFPIGTKYDKMFFDDYGKHLSECDLANKDDVFNLHQFCDDMNIASNLQSAFFRSVKELSMSKDELNNPEHQKEIRPNVVFDCTLKSTAKLVKIATSCIDAGYDPRCIHIVWILNSHEVAKNQNAARPRRVPGEVLDDTHEGVSKTFRKLFDKSIEITDNEDLNKIVDGDIWIFFNQSNVDNFVKVGDKKSPYFKGGKKHDVGIQMDKINVVKVKSAGKPMPSYEEIMNKKVKEYDKDGNMISNDKITVADKICEYVPTNTRTIWNKIDGD